MITSSRIDRATLLKSGGTAALATLFAGSLEANADACCAPIDLTYDSTAFGLTAALEQHYAQRALPPHGIRLLKARAPTPPPKIGGGWTPLFLIPNAQASGVDENGQGHGLEGKFEPPQRLNYGIWVYTR